MHPSRVSILVVACALAAAGCSATRGLIGPDPVVDAPLGIVAVLPIERELSAGIDRLPPRTERIVTAHVYGALTDSSRWRFVPPMTVEDALSGISSVYDVVDRAQALGEAVDAEAVIAGRLSRFVERVGSDYGADAPASVAFELMLVETSSGDVLWRGEFDETQESLSTNLLKFWQFWRGGPRWFSASEFVELGVDRLIEDLEAHLP